MKPFRFTFEISDEKGITLTPEQKKAIDEAIVSIDTVGTTEHDMVMEETQKRYPHLFKR